MYLLQDTENFWKVLIHLYDGHSYHLTLDACEVGLSIWANISDFIHSLERMRYSWGWIRWLLFYISCSMWGIVPQGAWECRLLSHRVYSVVTYILSGSFHPSCVPVQGWGDTQPCTIISSCFWSNPKKVQMRKWGWSLSVIWRDFVWIVINSDCRVHQLYRPANVSV